MQWRGVWSFWSSRARTVARVRRPAQCNALSRKSVAEGSCADELIPSLGCPDHRAPHFLPTLTRRQARRGRSVARGRHVQGRRGRSHEGQHRRLRRQPRVYELRGAVSAAALEVERLVAAQRAGKATSAQVTPSSAAGMALTSVPSVAGLVNVCTVVQLAPRPCCAAKSTRTIL